MGPADIAQLAAALLEAIERGEVEATPAEAAFLRSLADLPATHQPRS